MPKWVSQQRMKLPISGSFNLCIEAKSELGPGYDEYFVTLRYGDEVIDEPVGPHPFVTWEVAQEMAEMWWERSQADFEAKFRQPARSSKK